MGIHISLHLNHCRTPWESFRYFIWWFGTWILWLSMQLGMSSAQLTNSYFSEGFIYHQVVMIFPKCKSRIWFHATLVASQSLEMPPQIWRNDDQLRQASCFIAFYNPMTPSINEPWVNIYHKWGYNHHKWLKKHQQNGSPWRKFQRIHGNWRERLGALDLLLHRTNVSCPLPHDHLKAREMVMGLKQPNTYYDFPESLGKTTKTYVFFAIFPFFPIVISTINHWIQPLINQLNAILGAPSCRYDSQKILLPELKVAATFESFGASPAVVSQYVRGPQFFSGFFRLKWRDLLPKCVIATIKQYGNIWGTGTFQIPWNDMEMDNAFSLIHFDSFFSESREILDTRHGIASLKTHIYIYIYILYKII